jgi:uncharacterized protein YcbX
MNGKRTAAIHRIRATFSSDLSSVKLSAPADPRELRAREFAFPEDTDGAAKWFSIYFDQQIAVRYAREGFPDDALAPGPTIVSTPSLRTVCSWFPGMSLDGARLRFRPTLEIDLEGLPGFWEDQLFGTNERMVRFRIGEVAFEGSNPCSRCVVPTRDPHSGVEISAFQKRFSDFRRAQLPPWSALERFDHSYRLATNTRVALSESGKRLGIGDALQL